MNKVEDLSLRVFDLQGREVYADVMKNLNIGVNYAYLSLDALAQGTYSFVIASETNVVSKTIVKAK